MNISICITVLNEEESIGALLDSLVNQSKKADEIIVVDGGSIDKTIEIINHYQKRFGGLRLLKERCSRSEGRNLGAEMSKGEIIAMTDAGCVAQKDWLKNLTSPFVNEEIDVAAGFYKMLAKNPFEKAESVFLGTQAKDFDVGFLPSTRSIAFRRRVWEKVGGFPENLEDAAEDTLFNFKLVKSGAKISRVKDAVVEWGMPATISNFQFKIYNYAKGDARSRIWFFPGKGLASHNIKALSVLLRYTLAVVFLIYSLFYGSPPLFYWFIGLSVYLLWAFKKAGFWGIVLQFVSDFGVMTGFISGIIS